MVKPVYDISPDDEVAVDWQQCRLVMEVNAHYLLYAAFQGRENMVALKYYSFPENSNQPYAQAVQSVVSGDPILQHPMNETIIIYNLPHACLVPAEQYNIDTNPYLVEL